MKVSIISLSRIAYMNFLIHIQLFIWQTFLPTSETMKFIFISLSKILEMKAQVKGKLTVSGSKQ